MDTRGNTGTMVDGVELLTSQHRDVEQLWSHLRASHASGDKVQADQAKRIITMLSQHDAIETQVLYPAVREVTEGDQLADHSLQEHRQVREMLAEVDGKDITDAKVFATLQRCIEAVMHHVEEEESTIFPRLRRELGEETLARLGSTMAAAMKTAPTHPHPSTPDDPVGATIAGTAMGVVDKARDALRRD